MCSKRDQSKRRQAIFLLIIGLLLALSSESAGAQTTAFTYQGG